MARIFFAPKRRAPTWTPLAPAKILPLVLPPAANHSTKEFTIALLRKSMDGGRVSSVRPVQISDAFFIRESARLRPSSTESTCRGRGRGGLQDGDSISKKFVHAIGGRGAAWRAFFAKLGVDDEKLGENFGRNWAGETRRSRNHRSARKTKRHWVRMRIGRVETRGKRRASARSNVCAFREWHAEPRSRVEGEGEKRGGGGGDARSDDGKGPMQRVAQYRPAPPHPRRPAGLGQLLERSCAKRAAARWVRRESRRRASSRAPVRRRGRRPVPRGRRAGDSQSRRRPR